MDRSLSKARILVQLGSLFLGLSIVSTVGASAVKPAQAEVSGYFNVCSFGAVGDGEGETV